jgi:hypothetical protein
MNDRTAGSTIRLVACKACGTRNSCYRATCLSCGANIGTGVVSENHKNEGLMEQTDNHTAMKMSLALLPAAIFTQNYAWMTLNSHIGIAFLISWALMMWSAWQLSEKFHILERLFGLTEISFFLLPVSAIIFTFVFGTQAVSSSPTGAGQVGAAIGMAIGGTVVVVVAFIIGIVGGIIMHLITEKYTKRAEASEVKPPETLSNQHGIILSLVGMVTLTVIMAFVALVNHRSELAITKHSGASQATSLHNSGQPEPGKVSVEITNKGFHEADWTSKDYDNVITMDVRFTNHTDKDIRGVEGALTFYDIFDNKILSINVTYDEGIPAHSSKVWNAGKRYNQFIDMDVKLKNTELQNLKYKWQMQTVVYDDGTKETFVAGM